MKKLVLALVAIIIVLLVVLQFTMYHQIQKINNNAIDFITKSFKFDLNSSNYNSGLFSSNLDTVLNVKSNPYFDGEIAIHVENSFSPLSILKGIKTIGTVSFVNGKLEKLAKKFFGDQKVATIESTMSIAKGHNISITTLPIEFQDVDGKVNIKPISFSIIGNSNGVKNESIKLNSASFVSRNTNFTFSNINYNIDFKDPIKFVDMIRQTAISDTIEELSIGNIEIQDSGIKSSINNIKMNSTLKQVGSEASSPFALLDSTFDMTVNNIQFKDKKFKNMNLSLSLKNIDKMKYLELIQKLNEDTSIFNLKKQLNMGRVAEYMKIMTGIFSRKPKLDIEDFSFENSKGDKLSSNLQLWLENESDFTFFDPEELKYVKMFGHVKTTSSLTELFGFADNMESIQNGLVEKGILIPDGKGYTLKLELKNKDIIFNDNVSLNAILHSQN